MEVDANSGQLISKLYSVSYGDLNGKKIQERVDISIHIADSGFPGSSAGKESDCNAGDPGLIPGSGRSPGEGIGYPFQYFWASLVAHLVKHLLAMQEPGFNPWVGIPDSSAFSKSSSYI